MYGARSIALVTGVVIAWLVALLGVGLLEAALNPEVYENTIGGVLNALSIVIAAGGLFALPVVGAMIFRRRGHEWPAAAISGGYALFIYMIGMVLLVFAAVAIGGFGP